MFGGCGFRVRLAGAEGAEVIGSRDAGIGNSSRKGGTRSGSRTSKTAKGFELFDRARRGAHAALSGMPYGVAAGDQCKIANMAGAAGWGGL